jgi:DNA-binding CsgD family transcriptional regulator/tetratricopeptide (TPR) repeat protein
MAADPASADPALRGSVAAGDAGGMSGPRVMLILEMSDRASSPVLVGRDEQMAVLEAAFASVRQGGASAVLLGGEAGVGKSRLVGEFGQAAASAGARVLTGGCLELGTDGLPFAPFTAVLRELVHEMGADAVASMLPGRTTRGLARLLPELGEPEVGGDPGEARARLFEEMLTALDHLTGRSPVVLVIEDAHWADRSSRDLLTFLIANQRAVSGLLIVVTFRSDELHRTHPLRPMLAALDRIAWVERVELPRLTRNHTSELAACILGGQPTPGLADALYHRSEGNPLFVEALLCADGELNAELPESLRDLLLDSVRALPEATQEVLRVASAGGEAIGHALLAAVTGLDDDALTAALRPAVTANVLHVRADGYAFRHELIREAVHEDLLPGEHGRLHSRFAEAIDADHALVPPGRAAVEMAHHWHSAHDTAWALIGAWQAAAQAERAVAPAERLSLLARVLELWEQVPDAAERIGADHARVLAEAASAAHDAGEYERGTALASSALAELDSATEPVRVARLLETRGHIKNDLGRDDFPEDFAAALAIVPADAAAARITILLSAARCMPRVWQERSYAEEALALARTIGDEASEANALLTLALFHAGVGKQSGTGDDPLRLIAQARAMAERAGAHDLLVKAAINESHLLEGAGEHELAVEAARRGTARDPRYLAPTSRSLLAINQVEPLLALGRWEEALRIIEGARDLQLSALPKHRAIMRVVKGRIALARGHADAAAEEVSAARRLLRDASYEDEHQLPFGVLEILLRLAAAGSAAGMAAAAQAIDGYEASGGSPRYAWPVVVAGATACLAAAGQVRTARDERLRDDVAALAGRLRTVAEKLEAFGPAQEANRLTFVAADAHVAYVLAADPSGVADAAGPADGARARLEAAGLRAAWDQAAAGWDAVGEPYPLAQALLHAAEAALACGDRDGAAEALRRAADLAASLGAAPLSEQIAILARRARIALPGPGDAEAGQGPGARGAGAGDPGLTGREREVLRLVAAGRSNREIAAELFISPKTASVHVSNILGKLGAASRGEAAAKAHALRLFDSG